MGERVLRLVGGPYDGSDVDADELFAGELRGRLAIHGRPRWWRVDYYDLDVDADRTHYRYVGRRAPRLPR